MLFTGNFSKDDLAKSKKRFYWVGGIMLVIGFLSLSMPMLASFAIETLLGFFLLAIGFGNAFGAYSAIRSGDSPWQQAFMAVISIAAGIVFLAHPLAGVMTLSILLAAYFLVDGITKIIEYFRVKAIGGSLWILLSGVLGVVLAFMMWKNFFTGAAVIGIILGIDLIFSGMGLILLGRGCSDMSKKM
ncbi:HdeD family acid-resistance protein [Cloacibacillus evryensis]|uniref:DUF308 domain-containing protein n=2 Tax=root TaxID=1 RepID=A0AAW5K284_9BACT|nr:DUF308 domain-containing protein [Cloacibacillus evryensis]EHL65615.1 hypothetical protein HMPREF1006_00089 [Synergistes sp. 3_1_syn1]MCQ4763160.1 DUF308 domain-containing protein [Cloacibacillus evryensis]MCQ4813265.1 DUF308 domain-containing protein [Cloacibacillus evryensis]MEA5036092.1 DUF308 domain-containing protein [Cloacibacillus evryensis]